MKDDFIVENSKSQKNDFSWDFKESVTYGQNVFYRYVIWNNLVYMIIYICGY